MAPRARQAKSKARVQQYEHLVPAEQEAEKRRDVNVITIPPEALWQAENAIETGLVYFETPNAKLRIAEIDDMTVDATAAHAPTLTPEHGQSWEVEFNYERV